MAILILTIRYICVYKPYWQKGEKTTKSVNQLFSDNNLLSCFHYCSLWHYQKPMRYKRRKKWFAKGMNTKQIDWGTSSFWLQPLPTVSLFVIFFINHIPSCVTYFLNHHQLMLFWCLYIYSYMYIYMFPCVCVCVCVFVFVQKCVVKTLVLRKQGPCKKYMILRVSCSVFSRIWIKYRKMQNRWNSLFRFFTHWLTNFRSMFSQVNCHIKTSETFGFQEVKKCSIDLK